MKAVNQIIFILTICVYQITGELFFTKLQQQSLQSLNQTICTILNEETIFKNTNYNTQNEEIIEISTYPAVNTPESDESSSCLDPEGPESFKSQSFITEIISNSESTTSDFVGKLCTTIKKLKPSILLTRHTAAFAPQVVKLVNGGNASNRIDITFMGDGYTLAENNKFFADINRLIKETFFSITFKNFLPLFNVWAIFVPSKDSGIGYNGTPKNTPFKLYRNKGLLRGVYTKNANYARQICKLTGPSGCDYPSLIANDDYYGGLGGEFAISTRSHRTGALVLNHELGHNFAKVGEEYDSGEAYYGANSATSLRNIKWKSWLTNPNKPLKEERLIYRILAYPSNDLDKKPVTFLFKSDGSYSRWYLFLSVTGAGEVDSLQFILDGNPLSWASRGFDDKEFFDWFGTQGFSKGQHNLTIISTNMSTVIRNIPKMVGSVTLYEYGNEDEFHSEMDYISAYPTWDYRKKKSYRPTNAGCLMRNMTHDHFCSICKEEMWLQFFKRISLIDSLKIEEISNSDRIMKTVTLKTLELGQFRKVGTEVDGERLEISWFNEGRIVDHFNDMLSITVATKGKWSVRVKLITPEVRNDSKGVLSDVKFFNV